MDKNDIATGFIVTAYLRMVEEDGLTPHEAMEKVRKIEHDIFFALQLAHDKHIEYK